jgi:hypothetical protein
MKGQRNPIWEKRFARVGVTVDPPDAEGKPHVYTLRHDCGAERTLEYLKVPREKKTEYGRCPKGCHRGVKLA